MTRRLMLLLVLICTVSAASSAAGLAAEHVSGTSLAAEPSASPPDDASARDDGGLTDKLVRELLADARQTPDFYGTFGLLAREARQGNGDALKALVMLAGDSETERHATSALADVGPAAEPALGDLLRLLWEVEGSTPRASIVSAIGKIGPGAEPAVGDLVGILESEPTMCSMVADALGRIGRSPGIAVPAIARALEDASYSCLTPLYGALGGFQSRSAVDILVANLEEEKPTSVAVTLGALGRIGPLASGAEPVVRRFAEDRDARVRDAAARSLLLITGRVHGVGDDRLVATTLQSVGDRWYAENRLTLPYDGVCIYKLEGEDWFRVEPKVPFGRAREFMGRGGREALAPLMSSLQPLVDQMRARGFPVRLGDTPCYSQTARDVQRVPR